MSASFKRRKAWSDRVLAVRRRTLIRLAWFVSLCGKPRHVANAGCRRNRHRPLLAPQGVQTSQACALRARLGASRTRVPSLEFGCRWGLPCPTVWQDATQFAWRGLLLAVLHPGAWPHGNRREVRTFDLGCVHERVVSCRSRSTTSCPNKLQPPLEREPGEVRRGLAATPKVARKPAAETRVQAAKPVKSRGLHSGTER
jgi:hypothetical protein